MEILLIQIEWVSQEDAGGDSALRTYNCADRLEHGDAMEVVFWAQEEEMSNSLNSSFARAQSRRGALDGG